MTSGNDSYVNNTATGSTAFGQNPGTSTDTKETAGMTDVAREAQSALRDTAGETIDTAKTAAQDIVEQTQQQAGAIVSQTVEQATQAIGEVKQQAMSTYQEQRDRVVEGLEALANALRKTSENLTSDMQGSTQDGSAAVAIGPFVEEAADRVAQSARFLRDKDMSGLLSEAQSLAKKQPMLFMGAMFGVGVVGARMMKGMAKSGDEQLDGSGGYDQRSLSGSSSMTGSTASTAYGRSGDSFIGDRGSMSPSGSVAGSSEMPGFDDISAEYDRATRSGGESES